MSVYRMKNSYYLFPYLSLVLECAKTNRYNHKWHKKNNCHYHAMYCCYNVGILNLCLLPLNLLLSISELCRALVANVKEYRCSLMKKIYVVVQIQ